MIRETSILTLIQCSSFAGFVSGSVTNVFEVIKTMMMNEGLVKSGKMKRYGLESISMSNSNSANVSYLTFIRNMGKEHGNGVYFRGIGYAAATSTTRAGLLLPFYEYFQRKLLNWTKSNNMTQLTPILPTVSGLSAKLVAQIFAFPFEYMATIKQSNTTLANKKMTNGFASYLTTGLVASGVFWTIQENTYNYLRKDKAKDQRAYLLSALIGSAVSGMASYPFDLIKTWRISHPEKFINKSTVEVANEIISKLGWQAIYSGLVPRVLRVTGGNLIFFSVYSNTVALMRKQPEVVS